MLPAYFNRFVFDLREEDAFGASHPGECDEDVAALARADYVSDQLDKIDPADIAAELREYGAWDTEELQDDEQNRRRIVWIAAGNIVDNIRETSEN